MVLDKHHLILYIIAFLILCALAGVYHQWRLDVETAKIKTAAQEQIIKAAEQNAADRQKIFEATVKQINTQRVTAATPPAVMMTRLQGLEPEMNVLPSQLVAPKPDAPKENLVLEPAQQVTLINRLADCKTCDVERDKLKLDILGEVQKRQATEKERDSWKDAAKGGSLWTRIKRRGWHFLEDAVIIEGARLAGGHP
jgi:hypothetical protein